VKVCGGRKISWRAIEKNKDQLATIMLAGVNYLNGQLFDLKSIAAAGHKAGAIVGYDLRMRLAMRRFSCTTGTLISPAGAATNI
jgi:hypothetical protein